jgi:hypothetical protein
VFAQEQLGSFEKLPSGNQRLLLGKIIERNDGFSSHATDG